MCYVGCIAFDAIHVYGDNAERLFVSSKGVETAAVSCEFAGLIGCVSLAGVVSEGVAPVIFGPVELLLVSVAGLMEWQRQA